MGYFLANVIWGLLFLKFTRPGRLVVWIYPQFAEKVHNSLEPPKK